MTCCHINIHLFIGPSEAHYTFVCRKYTSGLVYNSISSKKFAVWVIESLSVLLLLLPRDSLLHTYSRRFNVSNKHFLLLWVKRVYLENISQKMERLGKFVCICFPLEIISRLWSIYLFFYYFFIYCAFIFEGKCINLLIHMPTRVDKSVTCYGLILFIVKHSCIIVIENKMKNIHSFHFISFQLLSKLNPTHRLSRML